MKYMTQYDWHTGSWQVLQWDGHSTFAGRNRWEPALHKRYRTHAEATYALVELKAQEGTHATAQQ